MRKTEFAERCFEIADRQFNLMNMPSIRGNHLLEQHAMADGMHWLCEGLKALSVAVRDVYDKR